TGPRAIQFDQGGGAEAGLRVAGDGHGAGQGRQGRGQVDRLDARAGDIERDGVRPNGRVGAEKGGPQAAGAAVVDVGDGEGGGGQGMFEGLQAGRDGGWFAGPGGSKTHGGEGQGHGGFSRKGSDARPRRRHGRDRGGAGCRG